MECPKSFWHDYYKICPICDHQIPEERDYTKEGFLRCHDCGAITHKNEREERGERRRGLINFHSFQIAFYLNLFVGISCLILLLAIINRVFQLILVKLFYIVFTIIRQDASLAFFLLS